MLLNPILIMLFKNHYISGELMAQELKISRAAIHKKISKLRELNYIIEGIPHKGFCIKKPYPFKILPEYIYTQLTNLKNIPLYFLEQTDSTNKQAFQMINIHKTSFFLLTREQIFGKGRMERVWYMQKDADIALSFVVKIQIPQQKLFSLIRMAALAVCQTLNTYCPNTFQIKWPNDIISKDNKKVCGILTEIIVEEGIITYAIIGIGINVNSVENHHNGNSLYEILNNKLDINHVIIELISNLLEYQQLFIKDENEIIKQWENLLAWRGEEVIFYHQQKEFQGIFESVNDDGSLNLIINKKTKNFYTGDIVESKFRKRY